MTRSRPQSRLRHVRGTTISSSIDDRRPATTLSRIRVARRAHFNTSASSRASSRRQLLQGLSFFCHSSTRHRDRTRPRIPAYDSSPPDFDFRLQAALPAEIGRPAARRHTVSSLRTKLLDLDVDPGLTHRFWSDCARPHPGLGKACDLIGN